MTKSTKGVIEVPVRRTAIRFTCIVGERDIHGKDYPSLLPGGVQARAGRNSPASCTGEARGPKNMPSAIDEAHRVNPIHLFGLQALLMWMLALTNGQLIKGGFPAEYGGEATVQFLMLQWRRYKERSQVEAGWFAFQIIYCSEAHLKKINPRHRLGQKDHSISCL